ncbi:hypothetical protein L3Q67_02875 [Saccharothrix sp. AJ9571]|nr:hypothetical protein L3Q67_02875 [Saccharothrix sp. AJ9571]
MRSEQNEGLELGDRDAWADDPDVATGDTEAPAQQLQPTQDGLPLDNERDEIAEDAGRAQAAGPEQGALHIETGEGSGA